MSLPPCTLTVSPVAGQKKSCYLLESSRLGEGTNKLPASSARFVYLRSSVTYELSCKPAIWLACARRVPLSFGCSPSPGARRTDSRLEITRLSFRRTSADSAGQVAKFAEEKP